MPIKIAADLWEFLPVVVSGLIISFFGLGMYLFGWAIGTNRGYKRAPEKMQEEVKQARYDRDVWEARAGVAQEAAKRYEVAMLELAGARERPGLRLEKGGRGV